MLARYAERAGPDRFTRNLGFQHIIDVHRHLKITDEQRKRFVALYLEALDEASLPDDEPFGRQSANTSSSAPASPSRTHGPRPTPTFTRSAKCLDGNG
jgi:hypothetical protein